MGRRMRIGLAGVTAAAALGAGAAIAVPGLGGGTAAVTPAGATDAAAPATAAAARTATEITARPDRAARREAYETALASELGIDVARLRAAQTAARQAVFLARLDDMVAAGRLTRAQADALRQAARDGRLGEALRAQRRERLGAALDGQVAAGLITRAQADRMLERFDQRAADGAPPWGRGGRRGHGGPADMAPVP